MPEILVVNGPNLNLLGKREPEIYGSQSLDEIIALLREQAAASQIEIRDFQSNHEGALIDFIHQYGPQAEGMIINPAAYTHTSIALRDAISSVGVRTIEVHLSNIYAREEFRRHSLIASVCEGQIAGLGAKAYKMALEYLIQEGTK